MPNRAKPSNWQPVGIEALDVAGLYSDENWQSIFALAEIEDGEQQNKLRNRVLNIAGLLNADIHYQKRPKPKAVQAALKRIQKLAEQLSKAISKTDKDTIDLLRHVAGKEPHNPDTEPPTRMMFDLGELRLDRVGEGVESWLRWSKEAAKLNDPQKKLTRTPDEAIHRAVADLKEVWELAGMDATPNPFLGFIRQALTPVLQANGQSPKLEHHVKKLIYG